MKKGIVSAGHEETAGAAAIILQEGGNAFDAALGALLAACVTEPVLSSLGGGGFMLALPTASRPVLYDFFVHTPGRKLAREDTDFFPIMADFGATQQQFHIGLGAIACPGVVRGMFAIQSDLGTLPMARIIEPACKLAISGTIINHQQAYILSVVEHIFKSSAESHALYGSARHSGHLLGEGEIFTNREFADVLDALAREGEDLFYRGEIAARIDQDCAEGGGHLRRRDLETYSLSRRSPLQMTYGDQQLLSNPPPSCGGLLIAFALQLLEGTNLPARDFGSKEHLQIVAQAMDMTDQARLASGLNENTKTDLLLPEFVQSYKKRLGGHPAAHRGTTHINVADVEGNVASLSISNGEGCAYLVPGTGIMLNNMLGEQDVVPTGFHNWPTHTRMSSMMAPSALCDPNGVVTAMGSGGSNRIRSAILQVLINLSAFSMPLQRAVDSPRLHLQGGVLNVEPGFAEGTVAALAKIYPDSKIWADRNMFFGGVHAVRYDPTGRTTDGAGDPRRGGVAIEV